MGTALKAAAELSAGFPALAGVFLIAAVFGVLWQKGRAAQSVTPAQRVGALFVGVGLVGVVVFVIVLIVMAVVSIAG